MGLFSFLKNAGAKLIDKDEKHVNSNDALNNMAEEAARRQKEAVLTSLVQGLNSDIEDFSLTFDGEVVTVYGQVDSHADREKIVLRLGNVRGVGAVDDRLSVVAPEKEPEATFYEVKRGDSLSKIAKQFYGDPMKYKVIFEANQPMLDNPDVIFPGQTLRIPNLG